MPVLIKLSRIHKMQQNSPQWKYERDFNFKEGISSIEGTRYDLRDNQNEDLVLLNDTQINHFIANGYLQLDTQLPFDYHQSLFNKFKDIIGEDNDFNPGNNLLPIVPEMNLVFDDPIIKGALFSVLGENYMMHPHRVLHDNPPGSDQQVWHHDSYWGYKRKVHNHHPWWVMIMYYPQDTFEQIGPTGIIPGSQYITQRLEDKDISEINVDGKAGVCMMIHYDIWHRKMKNLTELKRFMVKFEFIRMQQPRGITWDNKSPNSINEFEFNSVNYHPIWKSQFEWISGKKIKSFGFNQKSLVNDNDFIQKLKSDDKKIILEALNKLFCQRSLTNHTLDSIECLIMHEDEYISLSASYSLAYQGMVGIKKLINLMHSNDGDNVDDARCFIDEGQKSELEMICRNAAHGLVGSSIDCSDQLISAYEDGQNRLKKYVCFILGEISSNSEKVLDTLRSGCIQEDPAIRLNAVEALGLKICSEKEISVIETLLQDKDDEVRFNAALALARNGKRSKSATNALAKSLTDPNRYVYGYALEALDRIDSKESNAYLKKYLKITRYCPYTSTKSLF